MELLEFGTELAGFDRTPADSCVAHDAGRPVRKLLASINATTGDLALARQLGCDTYLLHHPLAGAARRNFSIVLDRMIELMMEHGVTREEAEKATADLRRRLRFNDHLSDWDHLASAADLLDLNLLNVHLAADELGRRVMVDALATLDDDATVEDAVAALRTIPELAHPANEIILVPAPPAPTHPTRPDAPDVRNAPALPIAVMHAGGTNGGFPVAAALFDRGVRTVLYIHCGGDDAKRLEDRHAAGDPGTLIITGHLASDAIGMNLLLDRLGADHPEIETIRGGGLRPFSPGAG